MPRAFKYSLGIDIGGGSAKALCLRSQRGGQSFLQAVCLNRYAEGLLDENELLEALREWLSVNNLLGRRACCGLSPRLTSTISKVIPACKNRENRRKLAEYAARSLFGLTGEAFCSDSQSNGLCPGNNSQERLCLSACRDSQANLNLQFYERLGVAVEMLSDDAVALANAFYRILPEEAQAQGVQAVLSIGQEETVVVVWKDGAPWHFGSLPLGGSNLTLELAQLWGCAESEAERRKKGSEADWMQHGSPGNQALRSFLSELRLHLEPLLIAEESERVPGAAPQVAELQKIWLTGGASLQQGLARAVSREYGCPAELFGVPRHLLSGCDCPPGYDFHPSLTLVYGLALQAAGQGQLTLSLLPEKVRWQKRKLREFPFLLGGSLLLLLFFLLLLGIQTLRLQQRIAVLSDKKMNYQACQELIPKLEKCYSDLEFYQKQMLPVVEYGARNWRFSQALAACRDVLNEQSLGQKVAGIYLADEFSFAEANRSGRPVPEAEKRMAVRHALSPSEGSNLLFAGNLGQVEQKLESVQAWEMTPVTAVPFLTTLYLGGVIARDQEDYHTVKKIQIKFHEQTAFRNVDDNMDLLQEQFISHYLAGWQSFLQRDEGGPQEKFNLFFLQLPLSVHLGTPGETVLP